MGVGQNQPIPVRPGRIFRVVIEDVKVQCRENIRQADAPCAVAGFGFQQHLYDILPDAVGNQLQLLGTGDPYPVANALSLWLAAMRAASSKSLIACWISVEAK